MRISRLLMATSLVLTGAPLVAQQTAAAPAQSSPYVTKAPDGAPNIVIVLLDDVGFGSTSTFGGPVATPALDTLAEQGLRYNRFHTTAICSPTRASLLTGRNPHATGVGAVANTSDGRPGYSGYHSADTATIARILRDRGYNTAMFGKWHQTGDWEISQSGPFDRWPTGEGFERFYGFLGGETDQFEPTLYEGTRPTMRPAVENYHLTEDLADKAVEWLRAQQSTRPDKPVLLYFAPGAAHAPLQAPRDWIDRYKGKFDQGWDKLREEIFARQKKLGVIPSNATLSARDPQQPAWDALTPDQKRVAARLMEVYAGFLAHTDAQVGRLAEALRAQGEFDNTLFIYVVGDNGASGEGGLLGSASYMGAIQGMPETDAMRLAQIDKLGGPETYAHIPAGWAWAMDAPFPWMKTVASHLGGTRNGMVVTWPARITDKGGVRSQFGHVNDIVPTILEATGIPAPAEVGGVAQKPMNGTSLIYSFNDAKAPERHTTQYFEVFGHRSIYHNGWMASAFHSRLPWAVMGFGNKSFEDDKWELYDLRNDYSQANDVAAKFPDKLAEMKALFMQEAAANQVLPLQNVDLTRPNGLPSLSAGRTSVTYHMGAVGIPEAALPRVYNRSWSLSATVDVTDASSGVIAAVGGSSAGWSLYLDAERRPVFSYRLFNIQQLALRGDAPLAPGQHDLRMDFDYDGSGYAKGGQLSLSADGTKVAGGRLVASPPAFFTIDETFDVGIDRGSPVGDYPATAALGYPFGGGQIDKVTIDLK
ncbi:sulfatase-like hydrolase/transferase [Altererythrobacter aerius]|uniref:Sulfatase-like hydrolase/transferase n=1 Tax=Tsuneonella aeria TaxID=1837929 RepID=A0A6I4TDR9_9SPHN|nr:arylsulfatase [Tsuneonella aeria]MXO74315.1 sulfatase-like hydrolase/transferase [Tsuneonella aeria]